MNQKLQFKKFLDIYGINKNLIFKGSVYFGYPYTKNGLNTNLSEIGYEVLVDFLKSKSFNDVDLKYFNINQIKNHINLKTYKGWRHYYHLPVNGQRTKTNAKTQKNKLKKRKK